MYFYFSFYIFVTSQRFFKHSISFYVYESISDGSDGWSWTFFRMLRYFVFKIILSIFECNLLMLWIPNIVSNVIILDFITVIYRFESINIMSIWVLSTLVIQIVDVVTNYMFKGSFWCKNIRQGYWMWILGWGDWYPTEKNCNKRWIKVSTSTLTIPTKWDTCIV